MNYRLILMVLLTGLSACQHASIQAEPVVVETRPVKITMNGDEAITVVEKGGIINTDTIHRTVASLSENSPALNVVQDQVLASELSSWLDKPRDTTLAEYLGKPVIRLKLEHFQLKYMVVVEHDWWGIEAQIWNLHTRKLDGVINGKSLVTSSKTSCSTNPGTWIIGTAATMLYIPWATMVVGGFTTERVIGNTRIAIENFMDPENTSTVPADSYLSISETVVQNGSDAIRGVPIPCESIHTLKSNPEIDSTRLGIYLAGKFNQSSAIAGN